MYRSNMFLPTFICLHVRLVSRMMFLDALKEATGLSVMRSSTLVRPYASSNWALLVSCASAHPSSVKYQSSTKLKDFSLPMANCEGSDVPAQAWPESPGFGLA